MKENQGNWYGKSSKTTLIFSYSAWRQLLIPNIEVNDNIKDNWIMDRNVITKGCTIRIEIFKRYMFEEIQF